MPYKDPEQQKAYKKQWDKEHRQGKQRKVWWGYGYPDSMPEDWREIASKSGYEMLAMFHDEDVTLDGMLKEPHYHVAVRLAHAGSIDDAKAALLPLGVKEKSIQWRDSWCAVARYLCHMDDPNKTQYTPDKVLEFGGADYLAAISRAKDKYRIVSAMQAWVNETDCYSFSVLMDYARENDMEWFMALCDNCSVVMREYIKSKRYDRRDELEQRRQELDAWASELEEHAREKAELEAGNWAMNVVAEATKERNNDSHAVCDWCGRPATGGSVGPEGAVYWCDVHQHLGHSLSEQMSDSY